MKCMILGCEQPARGNVDTTEESGVVVPAHFCRYCTSHRCELEVFLIRRARR